MDGLFQTNSLKLFVLLIFTGTCASNNDAVSVSAVSNGLAYMQEENVLIRHKRATAAGLVDIAQFVDKSAAGKSHMIYVDDTMARLIFQVTVYHANPVIMVNTPSKMPYVKHPTLTGDPAVGDGKIVATLDIPITSPTDYGFWEVKKLDTVEWNVKIQGESLVSIKQQLYELGTNTPINGYPVIGSSYKLVISVTGVSNIHSGDIAFLFSRQKVSPIGMSPLTDNGNGTFVAAMVTMPSEAFMVSLQGKDNSNHLFRRLDVTEMIPVTVELTVPPYTGATIAEYATFNISFVVTNLLNTKHDIEVRIEDSRGYAQQPMFLLSTLKVGESFNGTFVLQTSFAGMTTVVKVIARQYLGSGSFSPGPVEVRNFTVTASGTASLPASTRTLSTSTTSMLPTIASLVSGMSLRRSSVGIVDIARFKFIAGTPYSVYVDDTMTRLMFSVAVERSKPVITVLKPSGTPYSGTPTFNNTASQGTVVATLDIPITSVDFGIWKFSRLDANIWDVTIQAESPVYFTYQLFEIGSNSSVLKYPIIGQSYNIEVTVEGFSQIQSVDVGFLYSEEKTAPVAMLLLLPKGGNAFVTKNAVTMPSEVTMVGIQGKDKTGHPYKRLDTKAIIPVSLSLEVPLQTGTFVEEYTSINITFTVTNILSITQDVDIRIEDDKGLIQAPKVITSNSLKPGENFTGTFKLTAGFGGLTTLVKILARQNLGGGNLSPGPIEWRNITTFQKSTQSTTSLSATTFSTTTIASSSTIQATSTTKPGSPVATNIKMADIARFDFTGKDYIVHVDATIKRLVLEVSTENANPVIMATTPSDLPYVGHPTLATSASGTVKATMDIPIASGDHGSWKFTRLDSSTWNVKVQAESPVSVTQQLFELGSSVPLTENPVPGKSYDIELTVEGVSNIKSVNTVFLALKNGYKGAGFALLTHTTGNKYEAYNVKIPNEIFMIGVQGMDNGKTTSICRRIDPTEITPMSLKLDVPSYSGVTIVEYSTFNVTFTVTNLLSTSQEIDVRIKNDRNFALAPTMFSDLLKPGEQFSGMFVLNVSFAGLFTVVKIIAVPRIGPGKFGPGPEEIRNFTVIKNETTTTTLMPRTTVSTLAATSPRTSAEPLSTPASGMSVSSSALLNTTPASLKLPHTTAGPYNFLSIDLDMSNKDANRLPTVLNGPTNMRKEKDSLLLMFLTMSEKENKSIRINL